MYNFTHFKEKAKEVEDWLANELRVLRTGRAAPTILDTVQVDTYGRKMAVKELASILLEDPRTIRVELWDKTQGKAIEKAIISSNLGLSVNTDDRGLRIIFPELTSQRREQLIKIAKQKLEEARVTLRILRDKTWEDIQAKEKQGGMGEDNKFRFKDELQKLVDVTNGNLDRTLERKVTEIKS